MISFFNPLDTLAVVRATRFSRVGVQSIANFLQAFMAQNIFILCIKEFRLKLILININ